MKRRLFANKPSRWSNLFDLDLGNPCNHNVITFGPHVLATQDPGYIPARPGQSQLRVGWCRGCRSAFQDGDEVVVDGIAYQGGVTFTRFLPDAAREKLGIDGALTPISRTSWSPASR